MRRSTLRNGNDKHINTSTGYETSFKAWRERYCSENIAEASKRLLKLARRLYASTNKLKPACMQSSSNCGSYLRNMLDSRDCDFLLLRKTNNSAATHQCRSAGRTVSAMPYVKQQQDYAQRQHTKTCKAYMGTQSSLCVNSQTLAHSERHFRIGNASGKETLRSARTADRLDPQGVPREEAPPEVAPMLLHRLLHWLFDELGHDALET